MNNKTVIQYQEYDLIFAKIIKAKFDIEAGWKTIITSDIEEGFKTFIELRPKILLLELISDDNEGTNGFDLLQKIKDSNAKQDSIIVILSDLSQDSDKQLVKELGADYYFVKSEITIVELMNQIKQILV